MAWLLLYLLFYMAMALYWARVAARENGNYETFFSAGHALPAWISALIIAGASVSGWAVLSAALDMETSGFSMPALLQAGIALALPGVVFFKRLWLIGQRLRLSSQGEMLRSYYRSEFLVAFSALVGVIFAVAFAGLQLRALSALMVTLSGGEISLQMASTVLALVLVAYIVIGGMRVVGYLGTIQTVLAVASILVLAGFSLDAIGGFAALNQSLALVAADPAIAGHFTVSGVIQFTAGMGRQFASGHEGTAVASLTLAFALMGFQASPLAAKIVLSTATPKGLAAGQTWVMAGCFGAVLAFAIAIVGAAAFVRPELALDRLLTDISPWFSGWIFIGLLCGAQLLAGLALLTAGEALVRHLYKPWFHGELSRRDTVTLTRVVIALLAVISVVMQALTPVALSAIGALALPLAFQLWTPLLGMTWLRWFTRPAVMTGVGFGIIGVLLTEPFGHAVLSFVGLDLPWGRWPWTIHSAAWGMAANIVATLLVSAFTQRRGLGEEAQDIHGVLQNTFAHSPRAKALRSTAWSVVLAWFFLAVGPGLIFGSTAFGEPGGDWILGMPSLWAWGLLFWALGLGMIWFLAYKMEMASPLVIDIPAYEPPPRLRRSNRDDEIKRLRALVITALVGFSLIVLLALGFGR